MLDGDVLPVSLADHFICGERVLVITLLEARWVPGPGWMRWEGEKSPSLVEKGTLFA
jgi:hypothetical protein